MITSATLLQLHSYAAAQVVTLPTKNGDVPIYGNSVALIVGLSEYNPAAGWRKLPAVNTDVTEVNNALTSLGFSTEVTSNSLDGEALLRTLRRFLSQDVHRDTRIVVYFSGHGWSKPDGSMGYIVPADAPKIKDKNFLGYLVSMEEIKALALNSNAKHILFVFDSCFSGAVFGRRSNSNEAKSPLQIARIDRPLIYFITSGDAGQEVPATSEFAAGFVNGILGRADLTSDGVVTTEELGIYLDDKITPNNRQTPQYGALNDERYSGGQMIFPILRDIEPLQLVPAASNSKKDVLTKSDSLPVIPDFALRDVLLPYRLIYFSRPADHGLVKNLLDSRFVTFEYQKTDNPTVPTNVVTCSGGVDLDAVKVLAKALVLEGVPLRGIAPSVYLDRKNTITIENYGRYANQSLLTAAMIDSLESCPQFGDMP